MDAEAVSATASGDLVLETRGLTKRFGGLVAVDGLSMAVPRGQIRGLIGPNGSGKTTTVNVLSGLYRPDGGDLRPRPPSTAGAGGLGRRSASAGAGSSTSSPSIGCAMRRRASSREARACSCRSPALSWSSRYT